MTRPRTTFMPSIPLRALRVADLSFLRASSSVILYNQKSGGTVLALIHFAIAPAVLMK